VVTVRLAVLVALLLAALVVPVTAAGQERAVTLAERVTIVPQVGVSEAGDAVVAWFAPAEGAHRLRGAVFAASRTADGRLGTPRRLLGGDLAAPRFALAVGSAGDAAVVLRRRGARGRRAGAWLVTRRVPGRRFGRPDRLAGPPGGERPAVAIGPDGTLLVAWLERFSRPDCGYVVRAAIAPRGRPFGAGRRVSGACTNASSPRVAPLVPLRAALGADGRGAIAWSEVRRHGTRSETAVVAAPVVAGKPGSPVTVNVGTGAFDLAAGGDGRAFVAWHELSARAPITSRGRVHVATLEDDGPSPPVVLSVGDSIVGPVRAVAASSGAAVVAWQEGHFDGSPVIAARRAPRALGFSAPELVHPCEPGHSLGQSGAVPAIAAGGDAAVAFHRSCLDRIGGRGPAGHLVARAPAEGPFGAPAPLGTRYARSIRLALGDAGPGLVAWTDRGRLRVIGLEPL
jgi:hypothetical protein